MPARALEIGFGHFGVNPESRSPVFMILYAIWSSNCDKSFDAEVLKLIVLIDLFIRNMEM